MKAYYEQDGITIYHGDCREVLPTLGRVDHVVTDPPYGIDYGNGGGGDAKHGWARAKDAQWDKERPTADLLRAVVAKGEHSIVWGGNYFLDALPFGHKNKWLIWDKCQQDFTLADAELAWCSWGGAIRRLSYHRALALKDGKQHPTQKPVEVMTWCLTQLPNTQDIGTVLDPFMGSGTTLVAAKRLGRKAIGIELNERYCEIAAKRLAQGALPLDFSA